MIFAMIAMGLVALAGIADLATEALEEGADDIEERLGELRDDPRVDRLLNIEDDFDSIKNGDPTPLDIVGVEGLDETLEGRIGNDNIVGNYGDLDTLDGGIGEDRLSLVNGNTGTGGPGADIFQVYPDTNGSITDFRPGVDSLRIDANEDLLNQDRPYAMDWRTTEDGVELHYVSEGAVEFSNESFVVLLEGLDVPPPTEDVTLTIFDDRQAESFEFTGDEINFAQRIDGTDANDQITLTDAYSDYEVHGGEGDDTVTFDSFRSTTYLEDGDDTYVSSANVVFGDPRLDAAETVMGGAGDDSIEGPETAFTAWGGQGDDTISAVQSDVFEAVPAMLNGGAGDDEITFGSNANVTGEAGADLFTYLPTLGLTGTAATVTDFDPAEDALVIQLDSQYNGPGLASLTQDAAGTVVQVDGMIALRLTQPVSDLSSIIVLQ